MIVVTRNNAGQIILIRVDGKAFTEDALREQIELAQWAKRRRESDRLASARYEEKVGRTTRNAVRAARMRDSRSARSTPENGAQTVTEDYNDALSITCWE